MDNQLRFYNIIGCYLDDERLAAFAITEFLGTINNPYTIYIDLINLDVDNWINDLEHIAETTKWLTLKEWCLQKQFELDMMKSELWSIGDMNAIEDKLCKRKPKGDKYGV